MKIGKKYEITSLDKKLETILKIKKELQRNYYKY